MNNDTAVAQLTAAGINADALINELRGNPALAEWVATQLSCILVPASALERVAQPDDVL